ncbi:MAG: EamA family transporter [Thiocapsa sp.]|jgi:transporter family protein|nr:EamA family transporter [Thiocapsa sp.]MCG6897929.1 EamA family transporter [Thiocapsa sp.]MCG6984049.1 EamA family transporter [Thiocapsa sp.]
MAWQLFALGSAFFAGLTAIFGKLGVEGLNSNLATLIRTLVILAMIAGVVTLRGEWQMPRTWDPHSVAFLVLSGLATGVSWLFYYRALQLAPASLVAPIDKLSLAFAVVLAVVFLGEALTLKLAIGGLLMLAGVLILAWP